MTRVYRGLARREHPGWVAGLRPYQALLAIALAVPVVLSMSEGQLGRTLGLAAVDAPLVALVVVPIRGRPAVRWLADAALFQLGAAMSWSRWQARGAAGHTTDPNEPDLPGVLTRVAFPDGPPFREFGRVCMIHDTREGRWGATAELTHPGVGMLSEAECERLAARLGHLLLALGHRDVLDRVSLLVRTVPDDGAAYRRWRADHEVPDAPRLSRLATDELDRTVGAASVAHQLFVTVSAPEHKIRKPAAAAGGGVAGRGVVLWRALDGLEEALHGLGVGQVRWLTGPHLAAFIRTGFHPASASLLAERRQDTHPYQHDPKRRQAGSVPPPSRGGTGGGARTRSGEAGGVRWAAAGPTHAPAPSARAYLHDGYATVSWGVLMPEIGTVFGALGGLLAINTAGERRSLAIHYEILPSRTARRSVRAERYRAGVTRDWKATRGFNVSAADRREASGARSQEQAIAAGHGLVRFGAVAAITVPEHWDVESHAARMEHDISGRFDLLRLDLAQDSGFVAAVLPLGIAMRNLRRGF